MSLTPDDKRIVEAPAHPCRAEAVAMKERGIIFSGPMVRAILDGRKTQTRRILPMVFNSPPGLVTTWHPPGTWQHLSPVRVPADAWGAGWRSTYPSVQRCPYGAPGDRLWVRETWQPGYTHVSVSSGAADVSACEVIYQADNASMKRPAPDDVAEKWDRLYSDDGPDDPRWRPSIHMPRWASRLTLEVVSVRVERLQDISEADARAEGVEPRGDGTAAHVAAFHVLWNEINGERAPWPSNPWVWVVEFRRAP